jgi:hypothetical protein
MSRRLGASPGPDVRTGAPDHRIGPGPAPSGRRSAASFPVADSPGGTMDVRVRAFSARSPADLAGSRAPGPSLGRDKRFEGCRYSARRSVAPCPWSAHRRRGGGWIGRATTLVATAPRRWEDADRRKLWWDHCGNQQRGHRDGLRRLRQG